MPDATIYGKDWDLEHFRIEYHKLKNVFADHIRQYECTRLIVGEGMRCAMDKGHEGKCGSRGVRFATPGFHQMTVQPDLKESPDAE